MLPNSAATPSNDSNTENKLSKTSAVMNTFETKSVGDEPATIFFAAQITNPNI